MEHPARYSVLFPCERLGAEHVPDVGRAGTRCRGLWRRLLRAAHRLHCRLQRGGPLLEHRPADRRDRGLGGHAWHGDHLERASRLPLAGALGLHRQLRARPRPHHALTHRRPLAPVFDFLKRGDPSWGDGRRRRWAAGGVGVPTPERAEAAWLHPRVARGPVAGGRRGLRRRLHGPARPPASSRSPCRASSGASTPASGR